MDIFNILTSIGTLMAALATLLTVLQMNKQRKESYKPIATVIKKWYQISYLYGTIPIIKEYKIYYDLENAQVNNSLMIEIINAGAGTMTDINWKIKTNIDEWKKVLRNDTSNDIYFHDERLIIKGKKLSQDHNYDYQNNGRYSYLSSEPTYNSLKITFPNYLLTMLKMFYEMQNEIKNIEMPKVYLELSYLDIGQKRYQKRIEIVNQLMMSGYNEDNEMTSFDLEIYGK
jgi:hypothetical protein